MDQLPKTRPIEIGLANDSSHASAGKRIGRAEDMRHATAQLVRALQVEGWVI